MIAWIGLALAGVEVDPPPRTGAPSAVTVTDDAGAPQRGETVRVVHRPGTSFARERAVGITDGRGRVEWTPEEGGLVALRVGDHTTPLRVGWTGPPGGTATLLAVLVAGALGAVISGLIRRSRSRSTT
jgi:hypothetical protein